MILVSCFSRVETLAHDQQYLDIEEKVLDDNINTINDLMLDLSHPIPYQQPISLLISLLLPLPLPLPLPPGPPELKRGSGFAIHPKSTYIYSPLFSSPSGKKKEIFGTHLSHTHTHSLSYSLPLPFSFPSLPFPTLTNPTRPTSYPHPPAIPTLHHPTYLPIHPF